MKTVKIIFVSMMHRVICMLVITCAIALMDLVDLFVALEMKVSSKIIAIKITIFSFTIAQFLTSSQVASSFIYSTHSLYHTSFVSESFSSILNLPSVIPSSEKLLSSSSFNVENSISDSLMLASKSSEIKTEILSSSTRHYNTLVSLSSLSVSFFSSPSSLSSSTVRESLSSLSSSTVRESLSSLSSLSSSTVRASLSSLSSTVRVLPSSISGSGTSTVIYITVSVACFCSLLTLIVLVIAVVILARINKKYKDEYQVSTAVYLEPEEKVPQKNHQITDESVM